MKLIASIKAALMRFLVADIKREITRHERELEMLRGSSRRVEREQIEEVEASIALLRRVLNGEGA